MELRQRLQLKFSDAIENPSVIAGLVYLERRERIGKRGKRIKDAVVYKFPNQSLDISDGWKEGGQVHFINDSGATILSCQEQTKKYSQVKYAVLQHKETSPAKIDYHAQYIDKSKCNEWIVYPWEEWSK